VSRLPVDSFCLVNLADSYGSIVKTCAFQFPEIDAFLSANQKLLGTDVIALAYKDGKIVYKKELEKQVGDFNGRVQVPAGVASQWLVAATVMAYVDDGKISLDDK